MSDTPDAKPDCPLTPEQEAHVRLLRAADLQRIDECLLSQTSHQWRKVARVIGQTMLILGREFPGLPDAFYPLRLKHLVQSGAIEAVGNLNRMRYSEIRVLQKPPHV